MKWVNWIDLSIITMCFLSFSSFMIGVLFSSSSSGEFLGVEEQIEEIIESILITFRYATQALRLCVMLRNHVNKRRKQRNGAAYDTIDLNDEEEGIEMENARLPALFKTKQDTENDDLMTSEEQDEADSAAIAGIAVGAATSGSIGSNSNAAATIAAMRE